MEELGREERRADVHTGPGLGVVRASVVLLRGEAVSRSYFSAPTPITRDQLDKYTARI